MGGGRTDAILQWDRPPIQKPRPRPRTGTAGVAQGEEIRVEPRGKPHSVVVFHRSQRWFTAGNVRYPGPRKDRSTIIIVRLTRKFLVFSPVFIGKILLAASSRSHRAWCASPRAESHAVSVGKSHAVSSAKPHTVSGHAVSGVSLCSADRGSTGKQGGGGDSAGEDTKFDGSASRGHAISLRCAPLTTESFGMWRSS